MPNASAFLIPIPVKSNGSITTISVLQLNPCKFSKSQRGCARILYSMNAKKRGSSDFITAEQELMSALEALNVDPSKSATRDVPSFVVLSENQEHSKIATLVAKLERIAAGFDTANRIRTRLTGIWRLSATDAPAVAANRGSITGFARFPGTSCFAVDVVLRPDGAAATVEALKVFPNRKTQCTLDGSWSVLVDGSDVVLQVTYEEARLFGFVSLKAKSKATVLTTFCGSSIRIGRTRSGHFYVYTRLSDTSP